MKKEGSKISDIVNTLKDKILKKKNAEKDVVVEPVDTTDQVVDAEERSLKRSLGLDVPKWEDPPVVVKKRGRPRKDAQYVVVDQKRADIINEKYNRVASISVRNEEASDEDPEVGGDQESTKAVESSKEVYVQDNSAVLAELDSMRLANDAMKRDIDAKEQKIAELAKSQKDIQERFSRVSSGLADSERDREFSDRKRYELISRTITLEITNINVLTQRLREEFATMTKVYVQGRRADNMPIRVYYAANEAAMVTCITRIDAILTRLQAYEVSMKQFESLVKEFSNISGEVFDARNKASQ